MILGVEREDNSQVLDGLAWIWPAGELEVYHDVSLYYLTTKKTTQTVNGGASRKSAFDARGGPAGCMQQLPTAWPQISLF